MKRYKRIWMKILYVEDDIVITSFGNGYANDPFLFAE